MMNQSTGEGTDSSLWQKIGKRITNRLGPGSDISELPSYSYYSAELTSSGRVTYPAVKGLYFSTTSTETDESLHFRVNNGWLLSINDYLQEERPELLEESPLFEFYDPSQSGQIITEESINNPDIQCDFVRIIRTADSPNSTQGAEPILFLPILKQLKKNREWNVLTETIQYMLRNGGTISNDTMIRMWRDHKGIQAFRRESYRLNMLFGNRLHMTTKSGSTQGGPPFSHFPTFDLNEAISTRAIHWAREIKEQTPARPIQIQSMQMVWPEDGEEYYKPVIGRRVIIFSGDDKPKVIDFSKANFELFDYLRAHGEAIISPNLRADRQVVDITNLSDRISTINKGFTQEGLPPPIEVGHDLRGTLIKWNQDIPQ